MRQKKKYKSRVCAPQHLHNRGRKAIKRKPPDLTIGTARRLSHPQTCVQQLELQNAAARSHRSRRGRAACALRARSRDQQRQALLQSREPRAHCRVVRGWWRDGFAAAREKREQQAVRPGHSPVIRCCCLLCRACRLAGSPLSHYLLQRASAASSAAAPPRLTHTHTPPKKTTKRYLKEINLDAEIINVDMREKRQHKEAWFLEINPVCVCVCVWCVRAHGQMPLKKTPKKHTTKSLERCRR